MNYQKIYDQLIDRAKQRKTSGYVERHHVIPRCMGGSDEADNLIALYPEEHFVAHVLLVKIYPEEKNLILAVHKMTISSSTVKRINRKLYGWLKRRFNERMKELQSGSGNSQFGTRWISNVDLKQSKKISKDEEIPEGWITGRNIWKKRKRCLICNEWHTKQKYCSRKCLDRANSMNQTGIAFSDERKRAISEGIKNKKLRSSSG